MYKYAKFGACFQNSDGFWVELLEPAKLYLCFILIGIPLFYFHYYIPYEHAHTHARTHARMAHTNTCIPK